MTSTANLQSSCASGGVGHVTYSQFACAAQTVCTGIAGPRIFLPSAGLANTFVPRITLSVQLFLTAFRIRQLSVECCVYAFHPRSALNAHHNMASCMCLAAAACCSRENAAAVALCRLLCSIGLKFGCCCTSRELAKLVLVLCVIRMLHPMLC